MLFLIFRLFSCIIRLKHMISFQKTSILQISWRQLQDLYKCIGAWGSLVLIQCYLDFLTLRSILMDWVAKKGEQRHLLSTSAWNKLVSKLCAYSRLCLYSLRSGFPPEHWFLHSWWIILASQRCSRISGRILGRRWFCFVLNSDCQVFSQDVVEVWVDYI